MADERFAYVWQYTIEPARRSEFLAAYDSQGAWVRLFSSDPSYIKTLLIQDVADENRYMTIDFWKSKADRDAFKRRNSIEFNELDKNCEAFTVEERFLGDFVELG